MKLLKMTMLLMAFAVVIGGCATKRYGRLQPLTATEEAHFDCKDIETALAQVAAFRKQIAEGSEINVASVGAFLGDFGIGNAMEKNAAEKTAAERETALLDLKAKRGC